MTGTRWVREANLLEHITKLRKFEDKETTDRFENGYISGLDEAARLLEELLAEAEPEPRVALEARLADLRELKEHVRCLSEWYEWMRGPGSCYPSPKQSMVLRHEVTDEIEKRIADLERSLAALPKEEA